MLKLIWKLICLKLDENEKSWEDQDSYEYFRQKHILEDQIRETRSYKMLKKIDQYLYTLDEKIKFIENHSFLYPLIQVCAVILMIILGIIGFLTS